MTTVGLLHPGQMGATVGAACVATGHDVAWVRAGRSAATHRRASGAGLRAVDRLSDLVAASEVVVSVCPPASAEAVADAVREAGFDGVYVDANAIAPATTRRIGERFGRFVDGGIIGPPAAAAGTTRMYLSGSDADEVAALWSGSVLDVRVVDGDAGAASALKMAYAAWTKVSSALLLDVRALARSAGVEAALLGEWELSQPGTGARSEVTATGAVPKAWRFEGEMLEIAQAFADAGLPDGFGLAAAELFRRLAPMRDRSDVTVDEVLARIVEP